MIPPDLDLVAHRGWTARFPENTLAALEGAVEAGARYVEVDVQLSSDLRPVLFHDRTLERLCGVHGAVHQRSLAELLALECADRERFGEKYLDVRIAELSGLAGLLARHRDVFAFVEIKRSAIERFGSAEILERVLPVLEPVRAQVALISFSLPFLAVARERATLPLGAVFDRLVERDDDTVRALRPEFVFCDVEGLPAYGRLDQEGSRLAVYEVADPALAKLYATRGAELVETFAIGEMLAALGRGSGPRS